MTLKTFTFPSFEEWNKEQEYYEKIGAYTCAIEVSEWAHDESKYVAAFAASDDPIITFLKKDFYSSIECDPHDYQTLKNWYEKVTVEINDKWKYFILDTYFCK